MISSDYSKAALSYDSVRFSTPGGKYADQIEKNLLARVVKGRTTLEVGTATGRFAVLLLGLGYEYTGVDLSLAMLEVASERTRFAAQRTAFLRMDGELMGFQQYFDNIICIRTFHFLPRPADAIRNFWRAAKKGGRCLVTFETDNLLRRLALRLDFIKSEQRYYKRREVEDFFRNSGFRTIEAGSVLRVPVTLYRKCPKRLIFSLRMLEYVWPWPSYEYVLGEAM